MNYNHIVTSPLYINAGLAEMLSKTGLLGEGPLPDRVHLPGYIAIEGGQLVWSWLHPDVPDPFQGRVDFQVVVALVSEIPLGVDTSDWTYEFLHHTRPHYNSPTGMLDAFVRVSDDKGILKFALRYGVLGICTHGLPASHQPGCGLMPLTPRQWNPVFQEPLSQWLRYAQRASAMLRVAAQLYQGKSGSLEDWGTLYVGPGELSKLLLLFSQRPSLAQTYLAGLVNDWLALGEAQPRLDWGGPENPKPRFNLVAWSAFGILGVQLMTAVARSQDVYICDGCGLPYLRDGRKPQAGRRNYCPNCGEREANRQRQRKWRSQRQESTLRREQ